MIPLLRERPQWREALLEVLGSNEAIQLAAVNDCAGLLDWLQARYGERAGQGVAVRVGRALFSRLKPPAPLQLGLLPYGERLGWGLTWLAEHAGPLLATHLRWRRDDTGWQVELEGRRPEAACAFWQGLLLETCYWFGGHLYAVEMRSCRRDGDAACTFYIPLQPLR
ncbi:hypothetical protein D6833_07125 [Candidatus Parcubacteria bacterium]|nr:MAG: hypothetical protein D6833_07125 [Candidatus Parcubacteria bacterium]